MKNLIVISIFSLIIIFGFISPFWDKFVVIQAFYGAIPLALMFLASLILVTINSFSKNKKLCDSLISLIIPIFILSQIASTFLVNKIQKFRSEKLIKELYLIQKQKKEFPENVATSLGIEYRKMKGENDFVLSFSRGFLIKEKYYSNERKWRSFGWND